MSESQSRYSIVERLTQKKLNIMSDKTKLKIIGKCKKEESGTKITFWPDDEIFSAIEFDYKVLETRFREIAFLNAGLKIDLDDKVKNKKQVFFAAGGLVEFVKWTNENKDILFLIFLQNILENKLFLFFLFQ